jgi:hypothetical protein
VAWRRAVATVIAVGVVAALTAGYLRLPVPAAIGTPLATAAGHLLAATRPQPTTVKPNPTTAAPPAAGTPDEDPLPAGWVRYRDPSGFGVAVPAGWPLVMEGSTAYFCEPGGSRMLEVGPWERADPDLATALRHDEAGVGLAGYRLIGIAAGPGPGSADWEYTYRDKQRGQLHGVTRGIVRSGRAYLVEWRTPVANWSSNLVNLDIITSSFVPPQRSIIAAV